MSKRIKRRLALAAEAALEEWQLRQAENARLNRLAEEAVLEAAGHLAEDEPLIGHSFGAGQGFVLPAGWNVTTAVKVADLGPIPAVGSPVYWKP